jgi:hypothetical protein
VVVRQICLLLTFEVEGFFSDQHGKDEKGTRCETGAVPAAVNPERLPRIHLSLPKLRREDPGQQGEPEDLPPTILYSCGIKEMGFKTDELNHLTITL